MYVFLHIELSPQKLFFYIYSITNSGSPTIRKSPVPSANYKCEGKEYTA